MEKYLNIKQGTWPENLRKKYDTFWNEHAYKG